MTSVPVQIPQSDLPALEALSLHETDKGKPASPVLSDDGSVHSSSEHSETSTLRYDQEPYHLFKSRVEGLCQNIWPPQDPVGFSWIKSKIVKRLRANKLFSLFVPSPKVPLIERLRGGDYNRIVGITLPSSKRGQHTQRDFILRVPRWDRGQTEREVATLDYVRQNSSIPMANVVAKDFSKENVLGSSYVIQDRILGSDLEILWDDLNHSQRCTIAREVGRVVKSLLALESPVTGYIKAVAKGTQTTELHTVVPFDLKNSDGDLFEEPEQQHDTVVGDPREEQTTLDFFKCQIGRWRAVDVDGNAPLVSRTIDLWDGMLKVIEEMDDLGLLTSDKHCLCHVDLYPRNIMAKIHPDGSVRITGILDWDEAVVAPKFVNCEPPGWLWGFDDDHTPHTDLPAWPYEIPGANDVPPTSEEQELKRIFEENAGSEYVSLAYDEHFRLSRGIFRVALYGLTSSDHYEAAERIISDWARLREDMAR